MQLQIVFPEATLLICGLEKKKFIYIISLKFHQQVM